MSKLSLSFRITQNGKLIREEKLGQTVIKIGKVNSAHLQLDDETVSRMHAIIEVLGKDVSLIDLGSTRGTFVNGQRINKAKLQSGDTITVGDTQIEMTIVQALESVPMPTTTQTLPPPVPVAAPVAPAPAPALRATAPAPALRATAPAPAPMFTAPASTDELGGAQAIEVATMLGDSVVNVKHCMDPKGGKITPKTWGFAAAGLACLLSSATAFAVSVNTAARNKAALDYWTHVQKKPAHAFRPATTGAGLDYLMFGGLAFGLLGVTAGLARARRERKSPFYRIGTAPGVEQALETAPSPDFPMVAPQGDEFVFNYGAGMDGEMTVNGQTTPLAELAATGRARPSASTPGAIEVPIPLAARIRVRSGQTTFLVSAVAQPSSAALAGFAPLESRTLKYIAGSLAVHLGVWAFLQTVPAEGAGINVDLAANEQTSMNGKTTEKDTTPPEKDPENSTGDVGGEQGPGATMELTSGLAGNPKAAKVDGKMEVKNNHKEPALNKEATLEQVRNSGWFGSESQLEDGVKVLGAQQDWESGFSNVSVNGPIIGSSGEGKGNFGGGVTDLGGTGGGCRLPPCGIIGVGRYGTIGNGDKVGDGWGGPGNGHGGTRNHVVTGPDGIMGRPTLDGDLDKAIIKRYIKRSIDKVAYCYEKQLLANPNLGGEIGITFYIDPNGQVKNAAGQGFDGQVASCVAGVISQISFPKPKNGGGVQVNYPFNFHPTGR